MNLLLDIGNSSIKWALYERGAACARGHATWRGRDPSLVADEQWGEQTAPERVLIASVAGAEVADAFCAWMDRSWKVKPEMVQSQAHACGVTNGYVEPQRLGVDRWLALIGARNVVNGAACVVDCGTAVTIDVLAQDGEHLGGLILPGLGLMRKALEQHTHIELAGDGESDIALLARDTVGGVRGGTLYACVAFIDRAVTDIRAALACPVEPIITGGDAAVILPLLRSGYRHVPNLVLDGLALLAEA